MSIALPNTIHSTALVRQNMKSQVSPNNIRLIFWPFVLWVNLYDFLGLCHLVPTHTLHLSRPYLMTNSHFQIFHKAQPRAYDLALISN